MFKKIIAVSALIAAILLVVVSFSTLQDTDSIRGETLEDLVQITNSPDSPVQIDIDGNHINVEVSVNISGDGADKDSRWKSNGAQNMFASIFMGAAPTYRELVLGGITAWSGDYIVFGKIVFVNVVVVESDDPNAFPVIVMEGFGTAKYTPETVTEDWVPGTGRATFYTCGDPNAPSLGTDAAKGAPTDAFIYVVSHEFGHAFGLGDAYEPVYDNDGDRVETVPYSDANGLPIKSIMSGAVGAVTDRDVEMFVAAYSTGDWQSFQSEPLLFGE